MPEDACQNHCQIEMIGLHYREIKLNSWVLAAPHARLFGQKSSEITLKKGNSMLIPNNSLITATPEEGRELAIKMARLIIKATQPDEAARTRLREVYANDAMMLIQIGHVVALEFATIAAANNYWKA